MRELLTTFAVSAACWVFSGSIAHAVSCTADVTLADQGDVSATGSVAWCINSLGSVGGQVLLPGYASKTYKVLTPIVLASNITLRGDDPDTTRLEYTATDGKSVLTNQGTDISALLVRDLRVTGDGTSTGQSCVSVYRKSGGSGSSHLELRDVVLEACGQYGAYFHDVDGLELDDVTLQDNGVSATTGFGIYLREVSSALLSEVNVSRSAATGIQIYLSRDVVLRDVRLAANGGNGVRVLTSDYVQLANVLAMSNGQDGMAIKSPKGAEASSVCVQNSYAISNLATGFELNHVDGYEMSADTAAANIVAATAISSSTEAVGTCDLIPDDGDAWPFGS